VNLYGMSLTSHVGIFTKTFQHFSLCTEGQTMKPSSHFIGPHIKYLLQVVHKVITR